MLMQLDAEIACLNTPALTCPCDGRKIKLRQVENPTSRAHFPIFFY